MSASSQPASDAAYQGTPGAFSEGAARALLGRDARLLPCPTLDETFAAVVSGRARRGVIPVENTLAGSIHKSYDLLFQNNLVIIGETVRHIDHALIALPGTSLTDIRRVNPDAVVYFIPGGVGFAFMNPCLKESVQ